MISKFKYITGEGIDLDVQLCVNCAYLEGNDSDDILKYYKSQSTGVKWTYDNREITIYEHNQNIIGYPTNDKKKVIVIYPISHFHYPAPNNAIIYNADGSFYKQLVVPKLISDLAKNSRLKLFGLNFEKISWALDQNNEIVTSITIGFNRDLREERVVNVNTGSFEELLSSGIR